MKEKIVKKQKSEKAKITDLQGNEIKRETIKKEKVTSKIKKHKGSDSTTLVFFKAEVYYGKLHDLQLQKSQLFRC